MLYTIKYSNFGDERKAIQRPPSDNFTLWIITHSKSVTRKGKGNVSRSVWEYIYLVLTSQVQARSIIVGNSVSAVEVQQVFKRTFNTLIQQDYSVSADIDKYQSPLEHTLSKLDFSVGTDTLCFHVIWTWA